MVAEAKTINNVALVDFKCQLMELKRYCINLKILTDGLDVYYDLKQRGCIISREKAMAIMYGAEALDRYAHEMNKDIQKIPCEDVTLDN